MGKKNKYQVAVIGGGHAGIEAAHSAAKMGADVALITMSLNSMGRPSCNPSIGGTAKGHIVKELDALGGAMPILADKAGLQFKMLNKSKGPAVWSPRAQIDKDLYPKLARELLYYTENLDLIEETVYEIIVEKDIAKGVILGGNEKIYADAVILCPGTFLNGVMYFGDVSFEGGRYGEKPSEIISDKLKERGLKVGRLKTGTPPRIHEESIDYDKIKKSYGDCLPEPFSRKTKEVKNRIVCHMTGTNLETHEILRTGFESSPMFRGRIKGAGPRYCPSIEDKINRFKGRDTHKILLEPEGLSAESVYANGFSTSLPAEVQERGIKSIPGLENAKLIRYGYAIEYDFFFPYQLKYTLETKNIDGLYFAGQLNGTSGYEEAAAQGIIAGINAALKTRSEKPFTLKRSEAYIGVLIDDLINKTVEEPYRIFTSSAEYRLILRQDNADRRLMKYGYELGLVDKKDYEETKEMENILEAAYEKAKEYKVSPEVINNYLKEKNETEIKQPTDLNSLAKRGKIDFNELLNIATNSCEEFEPLKKDLTLADALHTEIKYEGYVKRQLKEIKYFLENEEKKIPEGFDYEKLQSLSKEAREKLSKVKPASLGQASRISGVSASDLAVLAIYLKK